MDHSLFIFQPAVLDNLVSSMKYVLTGMGLLRINLAIPKNRVRFYWRYKSIDKVRFNANTLNSKVYMYI